MFVDDSQIRRFALAVKFLPEIATRHLLRTALLIMETNKARHRKSQLVGRPGLIRRTGGLVSSVRTEVDGSVSGGIESVAARSYFGPPASKYARIHELGTFSAGGSLPDIVPVRAKFLVFKIGADTIFAKSVAIPPRLRWFATWDGGFADRGRLFNAMITSTVKDVVKEMAKPPSGRGIF